MEEQIELILAKALEVAPIAVEQLIRFNTIVDIILMLTLLIPIIYFVLVMIFDKDDLDFENGHSVGLICTGLFGLLAFICGFVDIMKMTYIRELYIIDHFIK